jgi:hypothetical protein
MNRVEILRIPARLEQILNGIYLAALNEPSQYFVFLIEALRATRIELSLI